MRKLLASVGFLILLASPAAWAQQTAPAPVSVDARLSMYKVFGDSTGVQMFNGQPNTLAIDGTTTRVPSGDMLRVERAFFNWTNIGGSKLYFSIGRRPSTDGPPLNFRQDEPRGGTPSGALFDYQYDGMTLGYHITDKTTVRACYGVGYSSGFGNGNLLKTPADRLKDVHLLGVMSDLYESDTAFVQVLGAHAWNVTLASGRSQAARFHASARIPDLRRGEHVHPGSDSTLLGRPPEACGTCVPHAASSSQSCGGPRNGYQDHAPQVSAGECACGRSHYRHHLGC